MRKHISTQHSLLHTQDQSKESIKRRDRHCIRFVAFQLSQFFLPLVLFIKMSVPKNQAAQLVKAVFSSRGERSPAANRWPR